MTNTHTQADLNGKKNLAPYVGHVHVDFSGHFLSSHWPLENSLAMPRQKVPLSRILRQSNSSFVVRQTARRSNCLPVQNEELFFCFFPRGGGGRDEPRQKAKAQLRHPHTRGFTGGNVMTRVEHVSRNPSPRFSRAHFSPPAPHLSPCADVSSRGAAHAWW